MAARKNLDWALNSCLVSLLHVCKGDILRESEQRRFHRLILKRGLLIRFKSVESGITIATDVLMTAAER